MINKTMGFLPANNWALNIKKAAPKNTVQSKATPFTQGIQLMLVSPVDEARGRVESFIANGYQKHFNATLVEFFPVILAIKEIDSGHILGAVGLRYAEGDQLFSEKYLMQSIESLISVKEGQSIDRKEVIELGHFIVSETSNVNTVMPLVAQFLKSLDVKWAIYTLSRPIKIAFKRMGIQLTHLQLADPEALRHSKTNWGNYYDFKPAVYYSSIETNMNT
ncbi:thermostable hemolysin [Marinicella rhabdoformis]|uniref:thermostable hemolysin n=1 Tax=Marinicella rhabdoformis TaxID=2580566 RepID=UPI001C5539EC|nr:thermostable hemolysin [Marinicella rhabdoformis]